jgi:hypothetical protein
VSSNPFPRTVHSFKKEGVAGGEQIGAMVSVVPPVCIASATAPSIVRHLATREATATISTEDRGPETDGTLHYGAQTSGAPAQILKVQVPKSQMPSGGYETSSSRSGLEASTPRDGWRCSTILNPTVLQPDASPWDFDKCE